MKTMINLTDYEINDERVFNPEDKTLVRTLLKTFQNIPSFGDMRKRATGVVGFAQKHGYSIAIVDCPCFMSIPLSDIADNYGITILFPFVSKNGKMSLLDINGNPIYQ